MAVKKSQEGGVSRQNKLWINYNDSTQHVISFIGQYLVHQVNVFMKKKKTIFGGTRKLKKIYLTVMREGS